MSPPSEQFLTLLISKSVGQHVYELLLTEYTMALVLLCENGWMIYRTTLAVSQCLQF